jgi:hypothetical protein
MLLAPPAEAKQRATTLRGKTNQCPGTVVGNCFRVRIVLAADRSKIERMLIGWSAECHSSDRAFGFGTVTEVRNAPLRKIRLTPQRSFKASSTYTATFSHDQTATITFSIRGVVDRRGFASGAFDASGSVVDAAGQPIASACSSGLVAWRARPPGFPLK